MAKLRLFDGQQMNRIVRFAPLVLWLVGWTATGTAFSMDRFAALSMIESGDDDFAHGQHTEVSRFQIRREVWLQTTNAPLCEATNPVVALAVAQVVAANRCQDFMAKHGRPPTDFEFYILWNSPLQVDHPSRIVRARATRFVNLIEKKE